MEVSTLKTKNHSKKNWFLQSCDSCVQRNEKMEDRMISSLNPLVQCLQSHTVMTNPNNQHVCFTNPQRIMQKKTRSKNNRQPRIDDNTKGHLKKIVGVNSNKWQKYKRNRKYNTRTREHIARNYIKIIWTYVPEDKE